MFSNREGIDARVKVIYQALNKTGRWYTGLTIKKFLRQRVFNVDPKISHNPVIESGRWSAYAHFSAVKSFENILDKHHIDQTKTVMVHPLCPAAIMDALVSRRCKIITLDITSQSLNWNPKLLRQYLRLLNNNALPDLIIHYLFNGLYEEVQESIAAAQELALPSLLIINDEHLNPALLGIFSKLRLGSVLWYSGRSFWSNHLELVLEDSEADLNIDAEREMYISWYFEERTRSILESHLSQSQDKYSKLVEAYYYLLLKKQQGGGFKALLESLLVPRLVLQNKISSQSEAVQMLKDEYSQGLEYAIPDFVFELEMEAPTTEPWPDLRIYQHSTELAQQAINIQTKLLSLARDRDLKIEFNQLKLGQAPFHLTVFSDNQDKLIGLAQEINLAFYTLSDAHSNFSSKPNLPIAQSVYKSAIVINLLESLRYG